MEGKEFKKLEEALKGLKKPELVVHEKARIRENLVHAINKKKVIENYTSLAKLKDMIKAVACKTKPSVHLKTRIKESLLSVIEKTKVPNPFLSSFTRNWQKVLASSLIFAIAFTTFTTIYIADIPVTKAAPQTAITEYTGNVDVIREDIIIDVEDVLVLLEGDIVVTGKRSSAIIRYIDDSISRLSPESELKLTKLYQDESKKSQTEVEVELNKGRVWNQVVNLSGKKSKFKVGVKNLSAHVSEKASFDIKVNEKEEAEVAVFENKVQVELPDEKKVKKQYVMEGYSIAGIEAAPEVERITFNSVEDEVWVEVNKVKDQEYKKEIDKEKSEETKEDAGFTPENPLYGAKKLNESTKLLLAGEQDKTKLKIEIAIKRLNEATVYLEEGKDKEAEELIKEFNTIFSEISDEIVNSEELQGFLEDSIANKEKDLSVVLPDSPKYPAKEALRKIKKSTALIDQDIKEAALEETEEKINEVKELIKEEKNEYVQKALEEVKDKAIDVAYDDVDSETDEVIEEHVETISSVKVLEEIIEEEGEASEEIVELLATTKVVLEEDIEDSLIDPEVEVSYQSWEIADPLVEEESVKTVVEEKLHPVVSESAVILSL